MCNNDESGTYVMSIRKADFKKKCFKAVKLLLLLLAASAITLLAAFLVQHEVRKDGLPVLGYHSVAEDDIYDRYFKTNAYVTKQSVFERQMKYLYDNGYQTLSMQEAEDYYNGKLKIGQKAICLTFDDGMKNFNTVVKPILEKYGFKGTSFVIGKKLEKENSGDPSEYQFLRKSDLVNTENVQYFSHSYNLHRRENKKAMVSLLSVEEIKSDFQKKQKDVI